MIDFKKEFLECKRNPIYFIENYCYINHPTQGAIKFKLYDIQKKFIEEFLKRDYIIVNKSRQVGMTTLMSSIVLWKAIFFENQKIIILSVKDQKAKQFLKKVYYVYDRLPDFLKNEDPDLKRNQHEIEFDSGSSISSEATGNVAAESVARGETANLLVVDEAAFIKKFEEIWKAIAPTLSRGGKCVLISTPNGISNYFYELWDGAQKKKNEFFPFFVNWRDVPEYDENWYKKIRPNFSDKEWAQEYEGDFLGSGDTLIDGSILREHLEHICDPIETINEIKIFKKPEDDKQYIISFDPAEPEAESDYNAIEVIDIENGEQYAEFMSHEFSAEIIDFLYRYYKNSVLVVEKNGVGLQYVTNFYSKGYNLYREYESLSGTLKSTRGYGFRTNSRTRKMVIDAIKRFFSTSDKWYSKDLYNELCSFVYKGDRVEAESGKHDDCVIAYGIALVVRDIIRIKKQETFFIKKEEKESKLNYPLPIYKVSYSTDDYLNQIIENDIKSLFKAK